MFDVLCECSLWVDKLCVWCIVSVVTGWISCVSGVLWAESLGG